MVSSGPDQREGRDENGDRPGGSGATPIVLKVVLGLVALAGFALLGAGGGLLIKHFRAPSVETPVAPAAASATASEPAAAPASVSSISQPAVAAVPVPASSPSPVAAIELPSAPVLRADTEQAETAPATKSPTHAHKPPRNATTDEGAAPAPADRSACLAKINAVNADLSLRNEPPTPAQLAILKRGCK